MKGVTIIAKTKKGELALRECLRDNEKATYLNRRLYLQAYRESVLSEPFGLRVEHRTSRLEEFVPPSTLALPIIKSLTLNGAVEKRDFVVVLDE